MRAVQALLMLPLASACGGGTFDTPDAGEELVAYCLADVEGRLVPVESDYLPRVVACENGAADFEALRAQAVAARSYLYYVLERTGTIVDGTGDQVYTCANEPTLLHYMAVDGTSGQILRYRDVQVAAFYVAGARQSPAACAGGDDDPTSTERFVTYNQGRAGIEVIQTPLGFVDPQNHANRGCMSQNGSHCLAMDGHPFESILRFYYGEDIELSQAEGPCVIGPTPRLARR